MRRDSEIVGFTRVGRGVLTRHDPDAFRRADCVAHALLAHAMPGDVSHKPRPVRVDECDRLRSTAKVAARGALDFDEVGAMIKASGRGLMLLDPSQGSPHVYVRGPEGPYAPFACVLRVDADHYEPIVHDGKCVLRRHSDALQVMRIVASAPALMPWRITSRGDAPAALLVAKVGGYAWGSLSDSVKKCFPYQK